SFLSLSISSLLLNQGSKLFHFNLLNQLPSYSTHISLQLEVWFSGFLKLKDFRIAVKLWFPATFLLSQEASTADS
ncbi:hypothetical protein LINPERHAP1_LOCUS23146, partial [Linum perenne]